MRARNSHRRSWDVMPTRVCTGRFRCHAIKLSLFQPLDYLPDDKGSVRTSVKKSQRCKVSAGAWVPNIDNVLLLSVPPQLHDKCVMISVRQSLPLSLVSQCTLPSPPRPRGSSLRSLFRPPQHRRSSLRSLASLSRGGSALGGVGGWAIRPFHT